MPDPQPLEWWIDKPGAGITGDAGYSSDVESGNWSDLRYFMAVDGIYSVAYGGFAQAVQPSLDFNDEYPATVTNAQKVKYVFRRAGSGTRPAEVVVTTREIFILNFAGNAYVNMTPIYETGTASCAGTTTVNGLTTAWDDADIAPGMMIRWPSVDNTWYLIQSQNTAISLTLTAAGPNTGGLQAYEIRRCFGGNASIANESQSPNRNQLFAQVFNGSLYVAGNTIGGIRPAVIKVPDIFANSSLDPANSIYLASKGTLNSTVPSSGNINSLYAIVGLKILQDGRVLIGTHETGVSGSGLIFNRVRTNSLDDEQEWLDYSRAYFADLVGYSGDLTGLSQLGGLYAAHFSDGIMLGQPTGATSPPLSWTTSAAMVGAASPEVVTETSFGTVFLDGSFNLRLFTGGAPEILTNHAFQKALFESAWTYQPWKVLTNWAIGYDPAMDCVHVSANGSRGYYPYPSEDRSTLAWGTVHLVFNMRTRQHFRFDWNTPITCFAGGIVGSNDVSGSGTLRSFAYGTVSAAVDSIPGTETTNDDIVRYLNLSSDPQRMPSDMTGVAPPMSSTTDSTLTPVARTLWIDFGLPGIDKTLSRLEAWVYGVRTDGTLPATTSFAVQVETRPCTASPSYDYTGATGYVFPQVFEAPATFNEHGDVETNLGSWLGNDDQPVEIARCYFDSAGTTGKQSLCGEAFRVTVLGLPKGFVKMRLLANLTGDQKATQSEG